MTIYDEMLVKNLLATSRRTRAKILIVEDDPSFVYLLGKMVANIDPSLRYDWCTNVADACYFLDRNTYRLVLSDFILSDQDSGMVLWEYCQESHPLAEFVMISSMKEKDFYKVIGYGMSPLFLQKPLDPLLTRHILQALDE